MMVKNDIKPIIRSTNILIIILFVFILSCSNSGAKLHSYYWNIEEVGIPEAWQYTNGSSEIVVAIIDSGIDFTHPDLVNCTWENLEEIPNNGLDDDNNGYIDDIVGWDFLDGDNDPRPPSPPTKASKHGTFIAGLIAADNDADLFVGVAPNVKIMPLRFLRSDLTFLYDDWEKFVEAIDYAIENGAHIINLSLQANGIPPQNVYEAIKRAFAANVCVVGVTGNIYLDKTEVQYPGNYSEVIAVSATTFTGEIADFSTYGPQTEICAPGKDVYSITGYESTIVTGSGTSFAAPLVSGAIALMLSLNSSLTITEIRQILQSSCTDLGEVGRDPYYGYGLLDIPAALMNISPSIPETNTSPNITDTSLDPNAIFLGSLAISFLLVISIMLYRDKNLKFE